MCTWDLEPSWLMASFKVSVPPPIRWKGVMITNLTSRLLKRLVEVVLDADNPSQSACVEEVSERDESAKAELSYPTR